MARRHVTYTTVPGATVRVMRAGGSVKETLYAASSGSTQVANPMVAGQDGTVSAYVEGSDLVDLLVVAPAADPYSVTDLFVGAAGGGGGGAAAVRFCYVYVAHGPPSSSGLSTPLPVAAGNRVGVGSLPGVVAPDSSFGAPGVTTPAAGADIVVTYWEATATNLDGTETLTVVYDDDPFAVAADGGGFSLNQSPASEEGRTGSDLTWASYQFHSAGGGAFVVSVFVQLDSTQVP